MLRAIEYFESIDGYEAIVEIETPLIQYVLERFAKLAPKVQLIGPNITQNRVPVFAFTVSGMHANDIADMLAESNICVRAGHHCTEPLHAQLEIHSSVRMSMFVYTTRADVDAFFEALESIIA